MPNKNRAPVPEASFASFVEDSFDQFGWKWYHVYDSRRDKPGFQDYVAVRGVWVYFIEVKGIDVRGDRGRLSNAQLAWRDVLTPDECPVPECKAIHAESFVWWPDDWNDVLEALR